MRICTAAWRRIRERLIEQEHGRPARHRDALAAGELARPACQRGHQAEDLGHVGHAALDLGLP